MTRPYLRAVKVNKRPHVQLAVDLSVRPPQCRQQGEWGRSICQLTNNWNNQLIQQRGRRALTPDVNRAAEKPILIDCSLVLSLCCSLALADVIDVFCRAVFYHSRRAASSRAPGHPLGKFSPRPVLMVTTGQSSITRSRGELSSVVLCARVVDQRFTGSVSKKESFGKLYVLCPFWLSNNGTLRIRTVVEHGTTHRSITQLMDVWCYTTYKLLCRYS